MCQGGYIKLHRSILEWEWWEDHNTSRLFLFLLLSASYETKSWKGITLNPGDYVSSIRQLAAKTGLTERSVRTALQHLISTQEVTQKKHPKFTIYTVKNWEKWQSNDAPTDTVATQYRHSSDTVTTQDQEREEGEEREEGKEVCIGGASTTSKTAKAKRKTQPFIRPTVDEVRVYCQERRSLIDPERFCDYYDANGWKVGSQPMKDWKAAIRNWERRDAGKRQTTGYYDQSGNWNTKPSEPEWVNALRDI